MRFTKIISTFVQDSNRLSAKGRFKIMSPTAEDLKRLQNWQWKTPIVVPASNLLL